MSTKAGFWVTTYRSISDAAKLQAYAAIALPAITAGGGKFLVRGMPAVVYEAGVAERTVVIQFPSVAQAIATHDSTEYKKALDALEGGCVREIVRGGFVCLARPLHPPSPFSPTALPPHAAHLRGHRVACTLAHCRTFFFNKQGSYYPLPLAPLTPARSPAAR